MADLVRETAETLLDAMYDEKGEGSALVCPRARDHTVLFAALLDAGEMDSIPGITQVGIQLVEAVAGWIASAYTHDEFAAAAKKVLTDKLTDAVVSAIATIELDPRFGLRAVSRYSPPLQELAQALFGDTE